MFSRTCSRRNVRFKAVLGVTGLGGAIPLFTNTSLTLEATCNRIVEDTGDLGSYQGVALLGGVQFGL